MKTYIIITSVLLAITATHSRADLPGSREIRLADCPPSVRESISQHSRGGLVKEVSHFQIGNQACYAAEVDLPGSGDLEIYVDASGIIIETREETTLAEIPAAARSAVEKLGGNPDDIVCHVKDGITTYHLEIERKGQPDLHVEIATDGHVVSQGQEADD
jgi:hypothetical protein